MSRREFLASSAMTGIALGLPGLVTGCGSDDDSAPNPQPREQRTFHFDLSFAEVSEARLRVLAARMMAWRLPRTTRRRALGIANRTRSCGTWRTRG